MIPAKYYYDEDTSNQWKKKRKTKEERQRDKRRKLDPNTNKDVTAEEMMKKRERQAKPVIIPGQKELTLKDGVKKENALKLEHTAEDTQAITLIYDDNGEILDKEEEKKAEEAENVIDEQKKKQAELNHERNEKKAVEKIERKKKLTEEQKKLKEKHLAELRSKLSAKITKLREQRKAPGTSVPGAPTSREQILEERRRKRELKKNNAQAEEEDEDEDDDADDDDVDDEEEEENYDEGKEEAAKSKEPKKSDVFYGNIKFGDGTRVTSDLTAVRKAKKKKGPANKDISAHLKKLEKMKKELEDMNVDKRKRVENKSSWSRALASVEGEKVKDDEQLLRKSLKRKEVTKRRTKREWRERKKDLHDLMDAKQQRRMQNVWIQKENKRRGKKDQIRQLPSHKKLSRSNIKRARAGFEGRIKTGRGKRREH